MDTSIFSVVVPGEAQRWRVFRDDDARQAKGGLLKAFQGFVSGLDPARDGILRIGSVAVCNHLADLARLSRIPTIFSLAPPPPGAVPSMPPDIARRDRVRALVRVAGTAMDHRGNIRQGRFAFLDRTLAGVGWLTWHPGTRICLSGFRIELIDSPRAGLHLRVGVAEAGVQTAADGLRLDQPRFISAAKPVGEGVYVVAPCDPLVPTLPLDMAGLTGDAYEDALLSGALAGFYGCTPEEAKAVRLGLGPQSDSGDYARRAA